MTGYLGEGVETGWGRGEGPPQFVPYLVELWRTKQGLHVVNMTCGPNMKIKGFRRVRKYCYTAGKGTHF